MNKETALKYTASFLLGACIATYASTIYTRYITTPKSFSFNLNKDNNNLEILVSDREGKVTQVHPRFSTLSLASDDPNELRRLEKLFK